MTKKYCKIFFILFLALSALPTFAFFNESLPEDTLRINYVKADNNYKNLGLWFWDDFAIKAVNWPVDAVLFAKKNESDAWVDLKMISGARKLSFMVIDRETGEKKSGNKVFTMNDLHNEVWIREDDDNVYVTSEFLQSCELLSAKIIAQDQIGLDFSADLPVEPEELLPLLSLKDAGKNLLKVENCRKIGSQIVLSCAIDLNQVPVTIEFSGKKVVCDLSWRLIDQLYAYDGDDLGCAMTGSDSAILKLWAPRAKKVEVLVYSSLDQSRLVGRKEMQKIASGIWTTKVAGKEFGSDFTLYNSYYQYEVSNPGKEPEIVLDPYAQSMAPVTISSAGDPVGESGDLVGKAAFVNAASFGKAPAAVNIVDYDSREEAIIYEVHVRDFTADPEIREDLNAPWGTFAAFKERLSYIRSLGVTHIQLLPVMAWYFGDETKMRVPELEYSSRNNNYNWGYDPHNYFALDGAYSQNVSQADQRVAEFKDLVDAIHKEGMGVILDVVYTHMAKADLLADIVPDYYFFTDKNGALLGDFGNNLATNRKMAAKLIADSVKHWFSVYKIDGMRWDMMGDATKDSVEQAFRVAQSINPKAIFIGEGWRTFKGHLEDEALENQAADQDWMAETDVVGVFSDEFRNMLKSGFGCEGEPRFLTGGQVNVKQLFKNIKAQPGNTPATAPGDMVQYIAAHDNLPLYDVIAQSIKKDPDVPENDLEIHRRIRLGNLLVLTSQGTAFVHAGQEFGRTKQWRHKGKPEHKYHELADAEGKPFKYPYFVHDSYDSSDAINMFSWKKATDVAKYPVNVTTREYTTGLIKLRRSTDAFCLPTQEQVDESVTLLAVPEIRQEDLLIAFKTLASDGQQFYVFINADSKARKLTLKEDLSSAEVIVDQQSAGVSPLARPSGFKLQASSIELEPLTAVIFRSKGG